VAERASALLLGAVERQAVADVPVAALLSGGIDSSLVVAAHARSSSRAIPTFHVRFPDRPYVENAMHKLKADSRTHAVAVAVRLGLID